MEYCGNDLPSDPFLVGTGIVATYLLRHDVCRIPMLNV